MDTKICSKCGRELPLDRFETGRNQCRDCRNARKKELRDANPEKHRQEAAKRQKEQTEWLHSLKTKCIICGESEPICLDFHHKDPSEKEFTIGKNQSKSKEKLLKEIANYLCSQKGVSAIQGYKPEEVLEFLEKPVSEIKTCLGGDWADIDDSRLENLIYSLNKKVKMSDSIIPW